jgi:hypothetical protein
MITEQPLAGKSKRSTAFWEMEVWALSLWMFKYTSKNYYHKKSDDIDGRNDMYEACLWFEKFQNQPFHSWILALIRELNALGLDFRLKFEVDLNQQLISKEQKKICFSLETRLKLRALLVRKIKMHTCNSFRKEWSFGFRKMKEKNRISKD